MASVPGPNTVAAAQVRKRQFAEYAYDHLRAELVNDRPGERHRRRNYGRIFLAKDQQILRRLASRVGKVLRKLPIPGNQLQPRTVIDAIAARTQDDVVAARHERRARLLARRGR